MKRVKEAFPGKLCPYLFAGRSMATHLAQPVTFFL
jgi:hypothetical protein